MTYGLDYSVKSLGGVLFFTRYSVYMPLIIKLVFSYIKPNTACRSFILNVSRIIAKRCTSFFCASSTFAYNV